MTTPAMRILIIGGYGVFGGRLAQLLADEPRLTLVVAGRSGAKAAAFCAGLPARATLMPAAFDRDGDVAAQLTALAPAIVIDATGPFQAYGDNPYRVVQAALDLGIHYMDLADGSDFVRGITAFDQAAKARGLFILAGVSSFPVLTAAVVRHLAHDLRTLVSITGGIAPSPYAGVGLNVIRAIASYAGHPVALTHNGQPASGYGLTQTMRLTICPPGRLPLRNILFSLVDVPDLQLLAPEWPGVGSIWMGAGPVPEVLHRMLIALAWTVRLKLLPSLSLFAPLFHRVINVVRWGEHRGGMFVRVAGVTAGGQATTRTWHLLAEGDDGPFIPSMAIEALVRRILDGVPPLPGARPAIAELELADYDAVFARRSIFTGIRDPAACSAAAPLFQHILGDAWDRLPAPLQRLHGSASTLATGRASVERGTNAAARAIGWLIGFPTASPDIPVAVAFTRHAGTETWRRSFGSASFSSTMSAGAGRADGLLNERFGPFIFGLSLVLERERLNLVVRRWSAFGFPMPAILAPTGDAFEHVDADGLFHFDVEIRLPLAGRIVRYRGYLVPIGAS